MVLGLIPGLVKDSFTYVEASESPDMSSVGFLVKGLAAFQRPSQKGPPQNLLFHSNYGVIKLFWVSVCTYLKIGNF